ncbi:MAG: S46 family peptidase [Verrucomicrobia bacterium]|nr:S46 family peptidase [Verrucomicrobiota bacterium]
MTADEGLWRPPQIPALASELEALGFTGDASAFADLTGHPMGAIVSLGGGSASFVSPDGLTATNHHCVHGSLQYNSKPERSLMEQGFLAKTRSDELERPRLARLRDGFG